MSGVWLPSFLSLCVYRTYTAAATATAHQMLLGNCVWQMVTFNKLVCHEHGRKPKTNLEKHSANHF